jgi:hypothetical protein
MDLRIGRVLELLRDERIGRFGRQFRGRAIAPFIPSAPGVRTNSAPRARSKVRRSTLIVSGIVRISL